MVSPKNKPTETQDTAASAVGIGATTTAAGGAVATLVGFGVDPTLAVFGVGAGGLFIGAAAQWARIQQKKGRDSLVMYVLSALG